MSVQAIPVELPMSDGVILRGQQWGEGPDWVVLIHDLGEDRDLDDWRPLLPASFRQMPKAIAADRRMAEGPR